MDFPPPPDELALQKEINAAILRGICLQRVEWYDEHPDLSKDISELYGLLTGVYSAFDERSLELCLAKASGDSQVERRFLYLRPFLDECNRIPLLSFGFSEAGQHGLPEWRLRVAVFCLTPEGDRTAWMPADDTLGAMPNPSAIGFRYETPEDTVGGMHSYFHVQPIVRFSHTVINPAKCDLLPCPAYFPVSQPAMPLDATNVCELMFAMLSSLYGVTVTKKIVTSWIKDVRPGESELVWSQFGRTRLLPDGL